MRLLILYSILTLTLLYPTIITSNYTKYNPPEPNPPNPPDPQEDSESTTHTPSQSES